MTAILITLLIFRIGVTIGYWKLFEKANVKGWKSLIPVYSEFWLMKIIGKPNWWVLYLFIPILNIFAFYVLLFDLLRCYGKNSLMSQFLIIFIGPVYLPYIGFKADIKYLGKLNELNEERKSAVSEWTEAIAFAVVAATLIRWLLMEAYTIPTPSMENSLLVGDFLFVSKFHYGTRTPKTPLQVPLTHQKIWFTDLPNRVQELHARHLQAVNDLRGLRLQQRVHQQQRDRAHQAERRRVHRHRDTRRQQVRLVSRVGVRYRRERRDQADNRAQKSQQRRDVRQRRQVMRALLQPRQYLHQALFHRLLDVVATTRRLHPVQTVGQNRGDRRLRLVGQRRRFLEVARLQERHDLLPQRTVRCARHRQVYPALDGYRHAQRKYDQDRVHECTTFLEKTDYAA